MEAANELLLLDTGLTVKGKLGISRGFLMCFGEIRPGTGIGNSDSKEEDLNQEERRSSSRNGSPCRLTSTITCGIRTPQACVLLDGQLIGDCYGGTEPIIALDCGANGVDAEEVPQGKGEVLPTASAARRLLQNSIPVPLALRALGRAVWHEGMAEFTRYAIGIRRRVSHQSIHAGHDAVRPRKLKDRGSVSLKTVRRRTMATALSARPSTPSTGRRKSWGHSTSTTAGGSSTPQTRWLCPRRVGLIRNTHATLPVELPTYSVL